MTAPTIREWLDGLLAGSDDQIAAVRDEAKSYNTRILAGKNLKLRAALRVFRDEALPALEATGCLAFPDEGGCWKMRPAEPCPCCLALAALQHLAGGEQDG